MTTMTEQATQVYSLFIRAMPEQIWDGNSLPWRHLEPARKTFCAPAC